MAGCEHNKNYTTGTRTRILEYLKANANRAVNVSDIAGYLRELQMETNVTTIYRYLDKLDADGTVLKYVAQKGDKAVYQYVDPGHGCESHLHLRCMRCGRITHLECDFMDEITEHIAREHGFDLYCRESVLSGLCKECREEA